MIITKKQYNEAIEKAVVKARAEERAQFDKMMCDRGCCACPYYNYTKMDCDGRVIGRPPQSWCYVEEADNG